MSTVHVPPNVRPNSCELAVSKSPDMFTGKTTWMVEGGGDELTLTIGPYDDESGGWRVAIKLTIPQAAFLGEYLTVNATMMRMDEQCG